MTALWVMPLNCIITVSNERYASENSYCIQDFLRGFPAVADFDAVKHEAWIVSSTRSQRGLTSLLSTEPNSDLLP